MRYPTRPELSDAQRQAMRDVGALADVEDWGTVDDMWGGGPASTVRNLPAHVAPPEPAFDPVVRVTWPITLDPKPMQHFVTQYADKLGALAARLDRTMLYAACMRAGNRADIVIIDDPVKAPVEVELTPWQQKIVDQILDDGHRFLTVTRPRQFGASAIIRATGIDT